MTEPQQSQQTAPAAGIPPQAGGSEPTRSEQVTSQATYAARGAGYSDGYSPEPSGWGGMVFFGAMMLIVVGAFQAIMGVTALFRSGYYLVGSKHLLVTADFTAWGWLHIVLGAVAIAAAIGLLYAKMWARILGITLAVLSAVVNLAFMSAYPLWSITIIALDVLVIYAIGAHGREVLDRP